MEDTKMTCLCGFSFTPRCPTCRTCYTCCNCTWWPTDVNVETFDVVEDEEPSKRMRCWRADRIGNAGSCD